MIQTQSLGITPAILSAIAENDEVEGAWRALESIAPEHLLALRRVATKESTGSSTRIEGRRLRDQEMQSPLSSLEIRSFQTRDQLGVAGYAKVMDLNFASWREIDVSENHLLQLHRELMDYSANDERQGGP